MIDLRLHNLIFEITNFRNHKERLKKIVVSNTYNNYKSNYYNNIEIKFEVFNSDILSYYMQSVDINNEKYELDENQKKFEEFSRTMDFNFKISCSNKMEMLTQFSNIADILNNTKQVFKMQFDIEISICGKDYNYCAISEIELEYENDIIKKCYLNDEIKKLKNEIIDLKDYIIIEDKFFQGEYKKHGNYRKLMNLLESIKRTIKSNKKAFLLSKLVDGDLKRTDFDNNKELYDVAEAIELIKFVR